MIDSSNKAGSMESRDNDGERPLGLIGGIGLTEVHVYAQRRGPDGEFGGCPHVHAIVDEGYFVLRGEGHVEFHDLENGPRRLELKEGVYAHFPPRVLHRLVSLGDLVILGLMGSAGLAEAGEARIYFGPEADRDTTVYARWLGLAKQHGLAGALDRRDQAVRAYMDLTHLWTVDRSAYFARLGEFFRAHEHAMAGRRAEFSSIIQRGPIAWGEASLRRLDGLTHPAQMSASDHSTNRQSNADVLINEPGRESALGMCGVLRPMLHLAPMPKGPIPV
jgi:mannose-6-phosphate isomerase-like protein (cupin superfamily)